MMVKPVGRAANIYSEPVDVALRYGKPPEISVRVKSANISNDGDAVRRWALLGRGIAYKSRFDVADDLAHGRLLVLCTDSTCEAAPLLMVVPSRRQLTPLLRCLRGFIAERTAKLGSSF